MKIRICFNIPVPALVMDFVHQCIAHPVLFFTREARWAERLHDATEPYPPARIIR